MRAKIVKARQYQGDLAVDDRGLVRFVNDFDFMGVKRFYQVENFSLDIIRAFHGHLKEGKYVFVTSGSILLCIVYLDNPQSPSKENKAEKFILSAKKPQVLFIPPRYAHGFRALEENTKVIFFSTSKLGDSQKDDYRYPYDYWGKDIWKIENR